MFRQHVSFFQKKRNHIIVLHKFLVGLSLKEKPQKKPIGGEVVHGNGGAINATQN